MNHTKEPWRVGKLTHPRDYETVRETVGPHEVVVDTDEGVYVLAGCNYNFPQDALANASRIVACVNACSGISTENLEDNVPVRELARRYNKAIKQRDELLVAMEGLHKVCEIALSGKDGVQYTYFETSAGNFVEATGAMQSAEAAIASAKGGAA